MATKKKKTIFVTIDDYEDGCRGICIDCGEIQESGVEPDARKYTCESCGEPSVYGIEEAIVSGLAFLQDE